MSVATFPNDVVSRFAEEVARRLERDIFYVDLGQPHIVTEEHCGYICGPDPEYITLDRDPTLQSEIADLMRRIREDLAAI